MEKVACPYCADADYLAAFTKGRAEKIEVRLPFQVRQYRFFAVACRVYNNRVTVEVERRGRRLWMPLHGKDFAPAWREFKVEVFGLESPPAVSIFPPGEGRNMAEAPFLFSEADAGANRHFFALRMTHVKHPLVLTAHWWPTHGRLVELRGPLSEDDPNADVEIIRKAFGFFLRETRGAEPKITERGVAEAIKKIPPPVTQKSVADKLRVTERTLERWRARQGMENWQKVVSRYG